LGFQNIGDAQNLLPFPNNYSKLTQSQSANLPGVMGWAGATNSVRTFFPMQVFAFNGDGTAIGGVPSGGSLAIPYSALSFGYAVLSPQGQWSAFTPITHDWPYAIVGLSSQSNQILVTDSQGSRLVNPVDGTSTPISQLVPPAILAQYAPGFGGPSTPFGGGFSGQAIDAKGDILVQAFANDGKIHALLLTPPGDTEAPVPEPTTLVTFALVAAGAIFRHRLMKSRIRA
jgi:hypothetical protein